MVGEKFWLLLPKKVGDTVAGHRKKPRADLLDWLQQPIGFDQLIEHLLQDVLDIPFLGHTSANEVFELCRLELDGLGNSPVLLASRFIRQQHSAHLSLKTDDEWKYFTQKMDNPGRMT